MTDDIQSQFAAAGEQRAAEIRAARAAKLAQVERKQADAVMGGEFLRKQFDLLDAAGEPEPELPSSGVDDTDIFNILPRF